MPLILIADDDPKIVEAVEKTVTLDSSFRTQSVSDPSQIVPTVIRLKPDLLILDVRFPGADGRHILKDLKRNAATRAVPVILLTGMCSEGDKVLGLDLGADDYVVKPFSAMELLARIRTVLRRAGPDGTPGKPLQAGTLRIEPSERRALLDGVPLRLQPKEFEVLLLLASHADKALSRSYLIENSSSYGLSLPTRSLDTHIKNLRKKLGASAWMIETVPKLGYRLRSRDG